MIMFCRKCGQRLSEDTRTCYFCGEPVLGYNALTTKTNDKGGFLWCALGFFLPVVGFILYMLWKKERPLTARSLGIGAFICSCIWGAIFLIYLIVFIISFLGGFVFILLIIEIIKYLFSKSAL